MNIRLTMALAIVASLLLVSGHALAQPQLPTFQSGDVLRADDLNSIVDQVRRNMSASGGSGGGSTHTVDCSSGTIAAAMDAAQPGDTIMITGTCNESVVVDKDGITLAGDGQDSTVIDGSNMDGSVILVKGQQNVTIKDLTVQNGLIGIHVGLGASAWLENVTAKNSQYKAGHNSGPGILIANSSDAILTGSIVATGNASDGITVWSGGRASVVGGLEFEGTRMPQASLQVNDNTGNGIQVGLSSSLQVQSVDGAYSTVQANDNDSSGIVIATGSSAQFGGGADVEASRNNVIGLSVINGSSVNFEIWPSRGVRGRFNDNKGWAGISVADTSSLLLEYDDDAGASITANGNGWVGLSVIGSSARLGASPASLIASASLTFSNNGASGNTYGGGVASYENASVNIRLNTQVRNNSAHGVDVWGNSSADLGTDSPAVVTVADNSRNGVNTHFASTLFLDDAVVENNTGHGIALSDNSSLYALQSTITSNGDNGINTWNGVSVTLDGASVTGNTGFDISAGRGSRLNGYNGSQVGTFQCDDSVLSYGEASCPDNQ